MKPNTLGVVQLLDINLREIVPFINWTFFFNAWKMPGKYDGIETVCECASCKAGWLLQFSDNDRAKAEEALKLFRNAQDLLRYFLDDESIKINASVGIFRAHSENDDILIENGNTTVILSMLRQQHPSPDGFCYSLADFINKADDYIGVFADTVLGIEELSAKFGKDDDIYYSILVKTLADRLAEATSEWLHYQVRTKYWGYNPDEEPDIANIRKGGYPGIRPAVGYPSLPDQSIIFELNKLLYLNKIGITLTDNGAMSPGASVCGLYFSHPKSKYFLVGKIDGQQLTDYSTRRKSSPDEMKKWLAANCKED